jgi:hypothetical protein
VDNENTAIQIICSQRGAQSENPSLPRFTHHTISSRAIDGEVGFQLIANLFSPYSARAHGD